MPQSDDFTKKVEAVLKRRLTPRVKSKRNTTNAELVKKAAKVVATTVAKAKKKEDVSSKLSAAFDSIFYSISSVLSEPFTLTLIIFATIVVISHNSVEGSLVYKFAKLLIKRGATKSLGEWVHKNANTVLGLVILTPSIFSAPDKYRFPLLIGSCAYLFFVPGHLLFDFTCASLAIRLAFRTKNTLGKIIVGLACFVLILVYHESTDDTAKSADSITLSPPIGRSEG